MRKFKAIAKKGFKNMMYYKSQNFLGLFTSIVGIIMMQFFWRAMYADKNIINSTSLQQMLLYSSMSWFLNLFNYEDLQNEIINDIKTGNINSKLLYPINYLFYMFSKSFGNQIWMFLFKGTPIILFIAVFLNPQINLSIGSIVFFIITALLGNLMLCMMNMIISLASFTWIEVSGLFIIKDILVNFFSGLIIPTWFYPEFIQGLVNVLPFQYMIQVPLAILCNRIEANEAMVSVRIQCLWILIFIILLKLIWARNTKRMESLGG